MLETLNYTRNPSDIEAVRVTRANMEDVASWCGAEVLTAGKAKFIDVPVYKPQNDRLKKAFIGDFVVFDGRGFKVYMPKSFNASFRKKSNTVNLRPTAGDHPDVALEVVQVVDPSRADALLREVVETSPTVVKKRTIPTAKGGVKHSYLQPSEPQDGPQELSPEQFRQMYQPPIVPDVTPGSVGVTAHPGDMPGVSEEVQIDGETGVAYSAPSPDLVD